MAEDMRTFIQDYRKARRWTLKELATRLGYASTTSIERLADGKANVDSFLRFGQRLRAIEDAQLTKEEQKRLATLLEKRELSEDEYQAAQLLRRLLREQEPEGGELTLRDASGGPAQGFDERYARRDGLRLLILGCEGADVFPLLGRMLEERPFPVEHYMMDSESAASAVRRIMRLRPLLYRPSYQGMLRPEEAETAAPRGLTRADLMAVGWQDEKGALMCDLLSLQSAGEATLLTLPRSLDSLRPLLLPCPERYTPLADAHLSRASDYLSYCRYCEMLERDRAVMRLSPDLGLELIPPEILCGALRPLDSLNPHEKKRLSGWDGPIQETFRRRWENAQQKRQPQYHVFKREAMWRFVKTGELARHAGMLRPLSALERAETLRQLLSALERNANIHMTFLQDGVDVGDTELTLYDGIGLRVVAPRAQDRPDLETMVTQERFLRVYRDFFLRSIVTHRTLPEAQALSELQAMLDLIEEMC